MSTQALIHGEYLGVLKAQQVWGIPAGPLLADFPRPVAFRLSLSLSLSFFLFLAYSVQSHFSISIFVYIYI